MSSPIHCYIFKRRAFTLIEVAMVILLMSIVFVISVSIMNSPLDESKSADTLREMKLIKDAIIGDIERKENGQRVNFGYAGDVGALPTAIGDLTVRPGGVSAYTVDSTNRLAYGWNGPYLPTGDPGEVDYTKDGWGNNYVVDFASDPATIVSFGRDGVGGGTGYDQDLTLVIKLREWQGTAYGTIHLSGKPLQPGAGVATVKVYYANGTGGLATDTILSPAGDWKFNTSVPINFGRVSVKAENPTGTVVLGPIQFINEHPSHEIQARLLDTAGMNLEVPIELIDYGLYSNNASTITFDRTKTSFNSALYDGTLIYTFEITATNADVAARAVTLVNNAGTTLATISVPAGVAASTRYEVTFDPGTFNDYFQIKVEQTAVAGDVKVYSGRVRLYQQNATKTSIPIPLIALTGNTGVDTTTTNLTGAVNASASTTDVSTANAGGLFYKQASEFTTLHTSAPWKFEVILRSEFAGNTAYASLYNWDTATQVTGTEVSVVGTTGTHLTATFLDTAANFTDLQNFELRIRTSNAASRVAVYKALLWATLVNVTEAQTYYRIARVQSGSATAEWPWQRTRLYTSYFSNPTAYYECSGREAALGTITTNLMTSTTDTGVSTGTVAGSAIAYDITTKTRMRTGALALTDGNRFFTDIQRTSGTLLNTQCFIIMNAKK